MNVFMDARNGGQAQAGDILILTSSTGAGHDTVAVALKEALYELAPAVNVRILDPLSGRGSVGSFSLGRWYDAMVAYAPWLWGLCYRATNNAWTIRLGMTVGTLLWARRLKAAVQTAQPGVIVSVHPLCTHLAACILDTIPAAPPLHCVVTDLVTIHRCWASDAVNMFYVATFEASDALIAMGIASNCIHLTGLPLRAAFAQAPHAPIGDTAPRVLLLGGGCPSRRIERIARALVAASAPKHLIVVCGRNSRLRHRLSHTMGAQATVLGWCDDIAALMRWSNVVVTKGGPTALAEALSQERPVIIHQVFPGQEGGNVALVKRTGSGCYIPDVEALVRGVAIHAQTTVNRAQATWWGNAAQRVAARLLTAHADVTTASHRPMHHLEEPALPRRVIDNPISGERIVIRESGAQTAGQLLSFDLFLPPGGHVPARHVHPVQEEQFTIIAGQMRFRLGRQTILTNPGDRVLVPAGTAHWFGNVGAGVSHAQVEVRPALRMEEAFETAATIGTAGHVFGTRLPRLSELARYLIEFQREMAVPDVPPLLVRALLAPLAWLGRRRDKDAATYVCRSQRGMHRDGVDSPESPAWKRDGDGEH